MAKPMTPVQTVAQLTLWRVPFKPVVGWETRNRNSQGSFSDVNGFMVHHTGDDLPDSVDLRLIINGRSDLPGPLAQFGCDDAGIIYLIGNGRANHAGGGDPDVLQAVINESYRDTPPGPRFHTGEPGAADGNSRFYGVETFYSGSTRPTDRAYTSLVLLAAAICDFHDWGPKSVIGHKEWSDWKPDPGSVSMVKFRADVAMALRNGPEKDPEPEPPKLTSTTRIVRARRLLNEALDLLDAAVEGGRIHTVKDVRDQIRKQVRRLPQR